MDIEEFLESVVTYAGPEARGVLHSAFQIAQEAHAGFRRFSGEEYIEHPLSVAHSLAEWHAPPPVLASALLHDILNPNYSNEMTLKRVEKLLGGEVSLLVELISKLSGAITRSSLDDSPSRRLEYESRQEESLDYLASLVQEEPDALVVKLADRLHNLETIQPLARTAQEKAANAAINVYIPLAGGLGIYAFKHKLEDLSFDVINPTDCTLIKQQYANPELLNQIEFILDDLRQTLAGMVYSVELRWQPFSLLSMQRRLSERTSQDLKLADAGSVVILVDGEDECYRTLGAIHRARTPVERQIRDFVGCPRENGYRSLHTQVKGPRTDAVNIIIRTHVMELIAERGIACQWDRGIDKKLLPQLPRQPGTKEIRVFTPEGSAKILPVAATPIDFAYAVHTDVGNHCIGVLINGQASSLDHTLQSGDRVEIVSGGPDAQPSLDWLKFVRTPSARRRIRQWKSLQERKGMVSRGRDLLDETLQRLGIKSTDQAVMHQLGLLARERGTEPDDVLISIGVGRVNSEEIWEQIRSVESFFNVIVDSPDDAALRPIRARCCHPSPGDEIVGHRKGKGTIVIHKRSCHRVWKRIDSVSVHWDISPLEPNCAILIEAFDGLGLVYSISGALSRLGFDMLGLEAQRRPNGKAGVKLYLAQVTHNQVDLIENALKALPSVIRVWSEPLLRNATTFPESVVSRLPRDQQSLSRTIDSDHNPFNTLPARGSGFYGRRAESQRIISALRGKGQNSIILLWGQKRIGKTSLLYRFTDQPQSDFLPVIVDMEGCYSLTVSQFLNRLMVLIARELKERIPGPAQAVHVPNLNRLRRDPIGYFHDFIERVQQVALNRPLLLMFDEFQNLFGLHEDTVSVSAIFSHLRNLTQHGLGISYILSGGGARSRLINQPGFASFFNMAFDERLGCLDISDAERLVTAGLGNRIDEDAIARLVRVTSGHPYYTQLLCHHLFGKAKPGERMDNDGIMQTVDQWIIEADESRFQHLWAGADEKESTRNRIILSAIAERDSDGHGMEFSELFSAIADAIPERTLLILLNDLAKMGVLKREKSCYSIEVELLSRWLRVHWPLRISKEVGVQ